MMVIQALSSSPRQLRSKGAPGDQVILDEFSFCDDQRELMKAALAFLMWGGRVRIFSTHNGENNPFNLLVEDIREGRVNYSLHRITLDDAIADGLAKRIFLRLGREWNRTAEAEWRQWVIDSYGEDADEELFCIPSQGGGVVFTRPMIVACQQADIPVITWHRPTEWEERRDAERHGECEAWCEDTLGPLLDALPRDRRHWLGEDFARNRNLTILWPGHEKPDGNIRVPFAVELDNIPFRQQEQILFYILDRLPKFSGAALDARGNGQALAEYAMQRYGSERVHRVMLSDKFYLQWFPPYKACVADRAIDLPKSADIIDDHRAVQKIRGVPKISDQQEQRGRKGRGVRHGDSAIAGMLLHYAVNEIAGAPPAWGGADPDPRRRSELMGDDDEAPVDALVARQSHEPGLMRRALRALR